MMLPCPCCKRKLPELARECPACHADLSLMFNYVVGITGSLVHAEQMTREGRLAEAVWAYLDVLDVDPHNEEARRQVGRVAAAVRHFDSRPPRHHVPEWGKGIWLVIVLAALALGFALGMNAEHWLARPGSTHPPQKTQEGD